MSSPSIGPVQIPLPAPEKLPPQWRQEYDAARASAANFLRRSLPPDRGVVRRIGQSIGDGQLVRLADQNLELGFRYLPFRASLWRLVRELGVDQRAVWGLRVSLPVLGYVRDLVPARTWAQKFEHGPDEESGLPPAMESALAFMVLATPTDVWEPLGRPTVGWWESAPEELLEAWIDVADFDLLPPSTDHLAVVTALLASRYERCREFGLECLPRVPEAQGG